MYGRIPQNTQSLPMLVGIFAFVRLAMPFAGWVAVAQGEREHRLFKSELLNGHFSLSAYVVSLSTAILPYIFAMAFLFVLPFYYVCGLNPAGTHFLTYVLTIYLMLLVLESMCTVFGCLLDDAGLALCASVVIVGIQIVFDGTLPYELTPSWIRWFMYTNQQWFVFGAAMTNQLENLSYLEPVYAQVNNVTQVVNSTYVSGVSLLPAAIHISSTHDKWSDILGICMLFLIYRLIQYTVLRFRLRKHQHVRWC